MSNEIPKDPSVGSVGRLSDSHVEKSDTLSIKKSSPEDNPGPSAPPKNVNMTGKKEGITLGIVGKSIARGLAGAVGGPLYAASFLVGAGLSLAVVVPMLVIAAPPALLGAGVGALIGAPLAQTKMGAMLGAGIGGSLPLAAGALVESVLMLPKALIFNTAGRLGAGLCAFAATGKRETKQLKGPKFAVSPKPVPDGADLFDMPKTKDVGKREKSTNEKLLDALYAVSFPELARGDEDIFRSTKKV